jgi:hypothetical protein
MSVFNLKSAQQGRINVATAGRIADERFQLGHGELCSAGNPSIHADVYNRPVNQFTLKIGDQNCDPYMSQFSAQRRIQYENYERPYIPLCAAGSRGGDLMGVGRDLFPQDLYSTGANDFVRAYKGPVNRYVQPGLGDTSIPHSYRPYDFSMDSEQLQYRG